VKRIELPGSQKSCFAPNLIPQGVSPLTADTWLGLSSPVCVVLGENIFEAETLCEDISAFTDLFSNLTNPNFYSFNASPPPDHPEAFDRICERLSLLSALRELEGMENQNQQILIATTFEALLGSCPLYGEIQNTEHVLTKNSFFSYQKLCEDLGGAFDYSSEVVCEEPGQFAVRGGLIDVYPVNSDYPVRIDFYGDEIEEIRTFDPGNQRSTGSVDQVRILSMSAEHSAERKGEFLKYLPNSVFWVIQEPNNLLHSCPLVFHESDNQAADSPNFASIWKRSSSVEDFFLSSSEIDAGAGIFEQSSRIELNLHPFLNPLEESTNREKILLSSKDKAGGVKKLFEKLTRYVRSGYKVRIAAGMKTESNRIKSLAEEYQFPLKDETFLPIGLQYGFIYHRSKNSDFLNQYLTASEEGLVLLTASEILGRERSRRPIRSRKLNASKKAVDQSLDFSELIAGDFLVHLQHGICRFESLGKVVQDQKTEEAITVEFADGVYLHVPIQESHLLSRYIGFRRSKPSLAKLGGKSWAKTKNAAELAAIDLAADLLRLQASRDTEEGHAYALDNQWQKEFEDAFPYSETPDQLRAIQEVKQDMESEKPMDRLVCGDVGYGKTEVAMRAAFKAIMDGKQVVLLAPTTILCQQHLTSFSERMSDYPIRIEMLSRFRTPSQQKKILHDLQSGNLDLIIGTHRLFTTDLKIKNLGLLIIDEEQRFGVEHKEKIKKLRANIDVLTLSATPIPRTLYFAMVGVRSFSTIETAPTNRRPIRTEIIRNTDQGVNRAIDFEVRRGGQIFYLHNRVKTIHSVARKLQQSFPRLQIAVGHGQMSESDLEKVMTEFVAGRYHILVCTTIIESGLDIPNCNTIIVEGADKFGLSQLYQLRGRVGRFSRQAYAYLLINASVPIKEKARKRLTSLRGTNSMGAGFKIALRDLELRGAGNLLGSEQSGHVAGVGFEMYCQLLRESVSRLKGEESSFRPVAVVRLDFLYSHESDEPADSSTHPSCIPEEYIQEPRLRIECYRKLAKLMEVEEVDEFKKELTDRFGDIPSAVEALLGETVVRCLAQQAGFDQIETSGTDLLCREPKRSPSSTKTYLRRLGKLPQLMERKPLLKLNEIIRFLKIYIHAKNQ